MEGKVALKKLLQVQERPYDNNSDALKGTEEQSIKHTVSFHPCYICCTYCLLAILCL